MVNARCIVDKTILHNIIVIRNANIFFVVEYSALTEYMHRYVGSAELTKVGMDWKILVYSLQLLVLLMVTLI